MADKQVYHSFTPVLVASLPMKDSMFMSKLEQQHLLPGDLVDELNAKQTPQDAAEHFMITVIEPCLSSNDVKPLQKVLLVMEQFNESLKILASEIKQKLSSRISATDENLREQCLSMQG